MVTGGAGWNTEQVGIDFILDNYDWSLSSWFMFQLLEKYTWLILITSDYKVTQTIYARFQIKKTGQTFNNEIWFWDKICYQISANKTSESNKLHLIPTQIRQRGQLAP